jgi:hypothetical protein
MKNDGMQVFRDMLKGGRSSIENLSTNDDTGNSVGQLAGGGGGQSVPPGFGGRGGGGMDPWQTSVEGRLGKLEERLGKVEQSLATLTERVARLPTNTKLYSTAVAIVGAITLAITFGEMLQSLTHSSGSSASDARQTPAVVNKG